MNQYILITTLFKSDFKNHFGIHLDTELTFQEQLDNIMSKVAKNIEVLRNLQGVLQRASLVTIYKTFMKPHLDHEEIIYD